MGMGPIIGELLTVQKISDAADMSATGRWMRLLERYIPIRKDAAGNGLQLAKRVLADQLIMSVDGSTRPNPADPITGHQ